MSDGEPLLSVILPCRNQDDHIERVLAMHRKALEGSGRSYELVVVPNACTDQTPAIVARIAQSDARIRCVDNPRGGWGLSVRTGLAAARGGILCYTNSARTMPEHVVGLLDRFLASGASLAKVRRVGRRAPLRALGSALYNLEAGLLFGIRLRDVNGTPKMFSRQLYERLRLSSDGDLLDLELLVHARRLGALIVEMPIHGFHRHGGRSRTGASSAWRMYLGAVAMRSRFGRGREE